MNCGLANLETLKTLVLPAQMQTRVDWDDQLVALGRGVAVAMERHCNRKFAYTASDTFECSADRSYVALPRFPLVSISEVAIRDSATGAWTSLGAVDSVCAAISDADGIVEFGSTLGSYTQRVRVTYTGGYFFETLESTDGGYPTAVPSGAVAVPYDLEHAWALQCQAEIEATDLLRGVSMRVAKDREPATARPVILPTRHMELLAPFRRFA